jgi:hypothetical protein
MKVAQFIAANDRERLKELQVFSERDDIEIKFVAGSQDGGLGLLYIWYEENQPLDVNGIPRL